VALGLARGCLGWICCSHSCLWSLPRLPIPPSTLSLPYVSLPLSLSLLHPASCTVHSPSCRVFPLTPTLEILCRLAVFSFLGADVPAHTPCLLPRCSPSPFSPHASPAAEGPQALGRRLWRPGPPSPRHHLLLLFARLPPPSSLSSPLLTSTRAPSAPPGGSLTASCCCRPSPSCCVLPPPVVSFPLLCVLPPPVVSFPLLLCPSQSHAPVHALVTNTPNLPRHSRCVTRPPRTPHARSPVAGGGM